MGFEPMSFSVKGRCPEPLDERALICGPRGIRTPDPLRAKQML
jgi:hypothetical protein